MHVLEQADPHHMGNAARVVPVALVLLQSVKECLGVSRLDAKNRKARFCQPFKQPLRQRSSLNTHSLQADCRITQDGYKVLRVRDHLPFPA